MMTKRLALCVLAIALGCGDDFAPLPPISAPDAEALQSTRTRRVPAADDAQLRATSDANLRFALDVYGAIRDRGENLFFSPHSISLALGMLYAGAEGDTKAELGEVAELRGDDVHEAFNGLSHALDAYDGSDGVALRVLNALWLDERQSAQPSFLDVLGEHYGAGVYRLDFATDPGGARNTINRWVSDNTLGHIRELHAPGSFNAATRLALTNAVYFKGTWAKRFDPDATRDAPFTRLDGSSVSTPMMWGDAEGAVIGESLEAVRIPYRGGAMSLVAIMPDDFASFEASLDVASLRELLSRLGERKGKVRLPRVELRARMPLVEVLSGLGMPSAFEPSRADLSGIDGTRQLFISTAVHEATVTIDESGTEAAAASGAGASAVSAPPTVTLDRPFVFLIVEERTGAVLFLGRVLDPSRL